MVKWLISYKLVEASYQNSNCSKLDRSSVNDRGDQGFAGHGLYRTSEITFVTQLKKKKIFEYVIDKCNIFLGMNA